jgi:DNA-binding IclR family transcriptional regulator
MSDKGIQVIDRAFDIMELLSLEKEGLGVTEIGSRIGLHKSTVHRILSAMAERGYIEKVSARGTYKLGLKLIEISSVYLNSIELKTEARPFLWELTSRFNQTTHLAILEGSDAIYIDKVDVMTSIRLYSQIGRRVPVYCSALGKSLLSGLAESELNRIVKSCSFKKYTNNTIVDKDLLLSQIAEVRKNGWALDNEEHEEGVRCIASPIFDYRGKVIAAVSIAGPASAISAEHDRETGKILIDTALNISKRLGYK